MSNQSLSDLPEGIANSVDHIGIAVSDLDTGIALYRDGLGLALERIEKVPTENVQVAFLSFGGKAAGHVELLAPLKSGNGEGSLARFIARKGPGLHHIAIAVPDIVAAMQQCRTAGLQLLDTEPRLGAGGKQVVFLHPKSGEGVLIEMCAPAPPA